MFRKREMSIFFLCKDWMRRLLHIAWIRGQEGFSGRLCWWSLTWEGGWERASQSLFSTRNLSTQPCRAWRHPSSLQRPCPVRSRGPHSPDYKWAARDPFPKSSGSPSPCPCWPPSPRSQNHIIFLCDSLPVATVSHGHSIYIKGFPRLSSNLGCKPIS